MKRLLAFTLALAVTAILAGCQAHQHEWTQATCITPQYCKTCAEINGEAAGHTWKQATCESYKTCTDCGTTVEELAEHKWQDATCTEPRTCSVCGKTTGEPLGHSIQYGQITKTATCSQEGVQTGKCDRCRANVEQTVPKSAHTPGVWVVVKKVNAAAGELGEQVQVCSVCGQVINREAIGW